MPTSIENSCDKPRCADGIWSALWWAAMLITGLAACNSTPNGILKVDEMKVILLHKLMAEEFYTNYLYRDTVINKDSARSALYAQVLQMHGTDSTTFYKSLMYYKQDPVLFKKLIDSATNYGTREREKRYAQPVTDTAATQ